MYSEFNLSSGDGGRNHNLMRLPPAFQMESMVAPISLHKREVQRTVPETDQEPRNNNPFRQKSKTVVMALDTNDERSEVDPDREPWLLKDDVGTQYNGNREGGERTSWVLFVGNPDGFRVVPLKKCYKFTKNISYRTLTTEEADVALKKQAKATRKSDIWMMYEKEDSFPTTTSKLPIKPPVMKSWRQKMLFGYSHSYYSDPDPVPMNNARKIRETEIDFEDEFADDEELDLGIEDKDEAKDATRRTFGKSSDIYSDDEDAAARVKPTAAQLELSKSLKKYQKNVGYEDIDVDDPYWYEVDEDEDIEDSREEAAALKRKEEAEKLQIDILRKESEASSNRSSLVNSPLHSLTTTPKREGSPLGDTGNKRLKSDLPPPPSAAQVVRNLDKQRRRLSNTASPIGRLRSISPQPATSISPIAQASSRNPSDPHLICEADLISYMNSSSRVTVKLVVAAMKPILAKDPRNKEMLRTLMKRCLNHDLATAQVTLKEEFKE